MPSPVIYERHLSGDWSVDNSGRGLTRLFFLDNVPEHGDAEGLLLENTPVLMGSLVRKRASATRAGAATWYGEVEYGPIDPNDAVGVEPGAEQNVLPANQAAALGAAVSLETTGQTIHITKALETKFRRVAADAGRPPNFPGTGPDEKLAIGLTKDRVEGCDIYAPSLTLTATAKRRFIDMNYINRAIYKLVGRVNDAPFASFAKGEVLYLGCTGNFTQSDRWSVTHKFACSPNEVNVQIGNGISIPIKGGWEYVWVAYDFEVVGGRMMQTPQAAYCQQVYEFGNFKLLEIGG